VWASSRGQLPGLRASVIIPGGQRSGLVLTRLLGGARALLSGRAPTGRSTLNGIPIVNLCTWLTDRPRLAGVPLRARSASFTTRSAGTLGFRYHARTARPVWPG
jgi:hypothetical protein